MPTLIDEPVTVAAAGEPPKTISEYLAICLPAFSPDTVHREAK